MQIFPARFFFFLDLPIKLRVVYLRNKQTNSVTNIEFYKHVQYCFCCFVIKSAGEAANKVLLSVVWNPLLIEINLPQIRALDIKREKVCAVCPYLLFELYEKSTNREICLEINTNRNSACIKDFFKVLRNLLIFYLFPSLKFKAPSVEMESPNLYVRWEILTPDCPVAWIDPRPY